MPSSEKEILRAKYYIETDGELADVGKDLAEIETTGKWSSDAGQTGQTELFDSCRGYVYEIDELEKGRGFVTLAIPMKNLDMENSAFSSLWLYMVGGATHALISYNKSRLVDFGFPEEFNKYFSGPKWGVDGLKKYLGVPDNEPIIGTIVKPTSGLKADEVAAICKAYAEGGLQFIKDDEKYMNTPHCPIKERVEKAMKLIWGAEDKTGKKVIYAPHVTTGPENILKFGETAIKAGARALMINIFSSSFSCLKMLRDEFDVPIYAHCGGKEALGRAPGQGVAPEVVAKLARLMGAEFFRSNILGGYLVGGTNEEIESLICTMRAPMKGIKDLVPALSGGLSPKNLGENLAAFGTGIMALAGSGITQHPGGIACGVEAMKAVAAGYMNAAN